MIRGGAKKQKPLIYYLFLFIVHYFPNQCLYLKFVLLSQSKKIYIYIRMINTQKFDHLYLKAHVNTMIKKI